MSHYEQLSLNERYKIFESLSKKISRKKIAKQLGRDRSTVSREIGRNSDSKGYYCYPQEAHRRTQKRKARHGFKAKRIPQLAEYVIEKLKDHWSPISIAGRWSREHPDLTITQEPLYAWIYSKEGNVLGLPKFLPRAKKRRGFAGAKKAKSHIPERVSIHERPEHINARSECGHFEADLMFNCGSQSKNVLTLIDRKSRFVLLAKNESKRADVIEEAIETKLGNCAVQSITYDNGSEFSKHTEIKKRRKIGTYFCDPGSPWQKGSVENMNKILRRFIPFNFPHTEISQLMLDSIANNINNIPRKILGFRTPYEVFKKAKCQRKKESRVKLAVPAIEAYDYNQKTLSVALRS